MQLGRHLHELWRIRFGVVISLAIALLVAVPTTYRITLFPPSLEPKAMEMATASTHVLVDTPRSALLDLRQGTYEFEGMTDRAVLVGNVMASSPVRQYIARRAGVPVQDIRATTPTTPEEPRTLADPENPRSTSDILEPTDEYRLKIAANPTVPVLDIYTQARTTEQAKALADASVDGLNDYLRDVAEREGIPERRMIRLEQLGRARGGVINGGVRLQATLLLLLFIFTITAAAVLYVARIRRGWRLAQSSDDLLDPAPETVDRDDEDVQEPVASGR